jgi:hypothetical protein
MHCLPALLYAMSFIHSQQCSNVKAAKERYTKNEEHKSSDVNRQGALKQKGIKQGLPVRVIQMF